jgi:transposase
MGVQLCDALERYLRGQDKALSVVSVPTPEQEQNRALIRYHRQIISDRVRCEARGKGLLCTQGIEIQGQWWQGAGWDQVQKHPGLRAWMKEQLDGWRAKILSSIEEEKPLRERVLRR